MDTREERHSLLITGASGYLGKLLVDLLSEDPGRFTTIVATDIRKVPPSRQKEGIIYEVLDVRDKDGMGQLFQKYDIDTVVHLASIVTPSKKSNRELEYAVDVDGTRHVLENCIETGVQKLILTSSGAAYGYDPDQPPLLSEEDPIRGHDAFAYAHHKRLIEEMLAEYREKHPELEQLIFRPGTILGKETHNQITAMFEKPVVLGFKGIASPFVLIWDRDVVQILKQGIFGDQTGIYNVAGDGVLTLREMAALIPKPYIALPLPAVEKALSVLHRLGLTQYGPEQVCFLQYRPVLSNRKLKEVFGYHPQKSTREVFEYFCKHRFGSRNH